MITYNDPTAIYADPDFLWNGVVTPEVLLKIGTRDLTYVGNTLRLKQALDRRCSARFTIESDVDLDLQEGERISLRLRKKRAFTGLLVSPVESWPGHVNRVYKVEGACFSALADRSVITRAFQNVTVKSIVTDIVNDELSDDGVTLGTVDTGPNVTEAVFAYVSATQALDKLAELAGFHWHINHLKQLDMGPVSFFPAPFDLDDIDEFAGSAERADSNRLYRNRQFVRGGKAETVSRVESWSGDDLQQTFVTGFPIARDPTVKVNTVTQTIGVKGIGAASSQWFWSRGSTEVTQNELDTPLGSSDTLEITYIGLFDLVVVSTDAGEVNRRSQLEGVGSSGEVDAVFTDPTITTAQSAFEAASGKLNKFGLKGRTLRWSTEKEGLEPNQTITVNLPTRGFSDASLLIMEVDVHDRGSRLIHSVRAVEGPDDGDWAVWFQQLGIETDPIAFRQNIAEEVTLSVLASSAENWEWDELITPTVRVCFTADGSYLLPTSTEEYDDSGTTYGEVGFAYMGDGAADLKEAC